MELVAQTEQKTLFRELYDKLTDGQKRLVRDRYNTLFGCKATFFFKINGQTRIRKAEEIFFINNLKQQTNE